MYPAMVSAPLRDALVVFVAARNIAVPFPMPLAPEGMVSHGALLEAVH
jgi:hypothetical protein